MSAEPKRTLWFLCRGVPVAASGGGARALPRPGEAEFFCHEGDPAWRPIAEFLARGEGGEGGCAGDHGGSECERADGGPVPVRPVRPDDGTAPGGGGRVRPPGVVPGPARGRPLCRVRVGARVDERFYEPLAFDCDCD